MIFNPKKTLKSTFRKRFLAYPLTLISVCSLVLLLFAKGIALFDCLLYDFNFVLRASEKTDEQIVIVEWDEKSIQVFEESTISDNTLASLLTQINLQKPKIVGLDLYRDVPVFSPLLSDSDNAAAYKRLNNLFSSTENLYGIQKTTLPEINPPRILADSGRVASSDIPTDLDGLIRRSHIQPQEDVEHQPAGIPYIGLVLGYQYLDAQGWSAAPADEDYTLKIENRTQGKSISIKPLPKQTNFSSEHWGSDFLINWHKGDKPFLTVSVSDIVTQKISPKLFTDRLVLIGSTAPSTADRHKFGLDRWNKDKPWRYGVEIPAHVAGSIINSALNQRQLINLVPLRLQTLLVSGVAAIAIILYYLFKSTTIKKFLTLSTIISVIMGLALLLLNIVFFKLGYWIPLGNAFTIICFSLFINLAYHIRRVNRQNNKRLHLAVDSLEDYFANKIEAISLSQRSIIRSSSDLENMSLDDLESGNDANYTKRLQKLDSIRDNTDNLQNYSFLIQKYNQQVIDIINYYFLRKTDDLRICNVNQLTEQIVSQFQPESMKEKNKKAIRIVFNRDPRIENSFVDQNALRTVLHNLLDNAYIASSINRDTASESLIKISTRKNNRSIEFKIEDNGIGLPDNAERIFEPFVSLWQGQGNGLFIAKTIVNLHKGKIYTEKIPNGTKFLFTFPLIKHH